MRISSFLASLVKSPSSTAENTLQPTSASAIPLTVRGAAAQSADLTEWEDSSGSAVAAVSSSGAISTYASGGFTARLNTAGQHGGVTIVNNGITAADQGGAINFNLNSGGSGGNTGGRILVISTSDYASAGNKNSAMVFQTETADSITEKMRLNADGQLSLGSASFGSGTGPMVFIANASLAPSTNPSGGGILYVQAGALKYRGSSGTITTIAAA